MSESTYIHFISSIFLTIISLREILKKTKNKEICKCIECKEIKKIYLIKNKKKQIKNNKNKLKEIIKKLFKEKKILFFTIPLIIFSIYNLLKENDFFDGIPDSYKVLGIDIDSNLLEIETAHREKLISIRKLRGTKEYIEKQKIFSDAYNSLKMNIKHPKFKSSISDLNTIKEVPNSYLIIIIYIFSIIYIISNTFIHMKNRSIRNKYGISYELIKDILQSRILENNLNDWKDLGVIKVISNIIKKSIKTDKNNSLFKKEIYFNELINSSINNSSINIFNKILIDCFKRLDTSLPYKFNDLDFISLSIYSQIFRLNILDEVLNIFLENKEINKIQSDEILNFKDKVVFTALQLLPCLKKICSSKQILYLIFRVHTDLLRGNEFARKISNSQPYQIIKGINKTISLPYKFTDKDPFFNPPLTIYSSISENLNIARHDKGLSSQYIPYENHTIIKLKFNPKQFNQGLIQKSTYDENRKLVHDPYLLPLKYEGLIDKLCSEGSLFLTPVKSNSCSYFLPKKSYTLFLYTDNTIVAVENLMDFDGERDVIFESRAQGCLLYSDDTGLAIEIK